MSRTSIPRRGRRTGRRISLLLILMFLGAATVGACDYTSEPVVIGEYKAPTETWEDQ